MAIGAPWVGTPVHGSTAGTSVTLDFTGASAGEWCYAAVALADSQASAPTAPAGWTIVTQGSEGTSGAASSRLVLYRRKKQAGDTTQAFSWGTSCKYESLPWSWPGLDGTTPDEGAVYAAHTSTANYTTGSVTPTSTDRWIGMVAGSRGTTSLETWTPDAAMTERSDSNHGGTNPFVAVELADTNSAVTQAGHTYTAVCSVADSHGGTIALALIPASGATAKSDTDSAAATDTASLAATASTTDTSSSAETATMVAALANSDTGVGLDIGLLTAAASGVDAAAAVEAAAGLTAAASGADTTAGTETAAVASTATAADLAAATETSTVAATSSAVDLAAVSDSAVLQAAAAGTDAGSGTEDAVALSAAIGESTSALESATVTVTITAGDAGAATDNAVVAIIGGVTPRPNSGVTSYPTGLTARPYTGTTVRP